MNNYKIGQMAFFYHSSELVLGLMLRVQGNQLEFVDSKGGKYLLPPSRICLQGSQIHDVDHAIEALECFAEQILNQTSILAEIQAALADQQGRTFQDILQALAPFNDAKMFAAFQLLISQSTIFSHKKGVFRLLSAEEQLQARHLASQKKARLTYLEQVSAWLKDPQSSLDADVQDTLAKELRSLQQEQQPHDLAAVIKKHSSICSEKLILLRRHLGDLPLEPDQILDASALAVLHSKNIWHELPSYDCSRTLASVDAFCIDEIDTLDYDDAISFSQLDDSWLLGLHIADVASMIPVGSKMFEDVLDRASSIYLPHKKVNMLPQELCQDRCSLKAGQERPVLSLYCHLDAELKLQSWMFKQESIKVQANLNYKAMDAQISQLPFSKLKLFADKLNSEREFAHSKASHQYQLKVEDGKIRMARIELQSPARLMMEELMILYNRLFAQSASEHHLNLIYRNINSFEEQEPNFADPKSSYPNPPAQAYLSPKPKYHNGIGAKAYLHATSPIRRAVDLINQAQFTAFLKEETAYYDLDSLERLIPQIEKRLRLQRETQRLSERYWLLSYLEEKWLNIPLTASLVRSFARGCLFELIPWGMKILVDCDVVPEKGYEVKLVLTMVDAINGYCKADLIF